MDKKVSVCNIYPKVAALDSLHVDDGPPNMTGSSTDNIAYDMGTMSSDDFKDIVAFPSSDFTEETKVLQEMADLLERGKAFKSLLYTQRSVSKALPKTQQDTDEATKKEIHEKTVQVLTPTMQKLNELREFTEHAVQVVRKNIQRLVQSEMKKAVQSEPVLDHLVKCIDMLIILDSLKDMKTSLKQDFGAYRRSFTAVYDYNTVSEEIKLLETFLINPKQMHYTILAGLKRECLGFQNSHVVISLLINHCESSIEKERYLLPDDLHMFYRVIPNCIYLLDADDRSGVNAFKHKAISLSKLQKLYKEFPFIPIYADTTMQVDHVLSRCRNWEVDMSSRWCSTVSAKLEKRYLLVHKYKSFRASYSRLTGEMTALLGDIRTSEAEGKVVTPDALLRSYTLVLECVQNIAKWSAAIREQCAYKYSNACHDSMIQKKSADQKVSFYERVVRYNYTNSEMYALLDVIGLMKGLGSLLISTKLLHLPLCLRYIHDDVQVFIQQEVARPLRKAHKRNRAIKDVMLQMRSICGDWVNYDQIKDDYKQKKNKLINIQREFPRRSVTPTVTQMTLLNRMVFHIFSARAPGMQGGMFADKDLKKEWIPVWEQFYKNSNYYLFFFHFQRNVEDVMDIGFLWFREHFLEMAVGEVQFPLRMSLPWLLIDFVINTATMKENIFFPMDIYNDAATTSLNHLRQQFLYDEVEAETALSFNQLVFSLGEDCFKYHKSVASSILVKKSFQQAVSEIKQGGSTPTSRYAALMQQRHINLLGRPVDLHAVLSASLNATLRKNIEIIIAKLESKDLTFIVSFKNMLDNVKLTHALLSVHLTLDSFEDMYNEMNQNVAVGQFRGKVIMHIFSELMGDIIPNFVYNSATQRFVRQRDAHGDVMAPFTEAPRRTSPATAQSYFFYGRGFREVFAKWERLTSGFFGVPHIEAMLAVLPKSHISRLVHESINDIGSKLTYDFSTFFELLRSETPPMKLPTMFGPAGVFTRFQIVLQQNGIAYYPELHTGVFQCLREVGNTLLFVRLLETVMTKNEDLAFTQNAFFLNTVAPGNKLSNADIEQAYKEGQQCPFGLQFDDSKKGANVERVLSEQLKLARKKKAGLKDDSLIADIMSSWNISKESHQHSVQRSSVLRRALRMVEEALETVRDDWLTRHRSTEGDIVEMDDPQDVLRVLSVLQFLFCVDVDKDSTPSNVHDVSVFGEGFSWGLCLIVHTLGLRKRFEFMDLSYHVLRLARLEPLPRPVSDKEYKKLSPTDKISYDLANGQVRPFLQNVKIVKEWNNGVFAILKTYLPDPPAQKLVIRPPPAYGQEKAYRAEKKSERNRAIEKRQDAPPPGPPPSSSQAPPPGPPPSRSQAPPSRPPPSDSKPPPPMPTSSASKPPPPMPTSSASKPPPPMPTSSASKPPPPMPTSSVSKPPPPSMPPPPSSAAKLPPKPKLPPPLANKAKLPPPPRQG